MGYIDLPEEVRVFAPLELKEDSQFEVGMEMDLVIEKLWEEEDKEIMAEFKEWGMLD